MPPCSNISIPNKTNCISYETVKRGNDDDGNIENKDNKDDNDDENIKNNDNIDDDDDNDDADDDGYGR